MSKQPEDPRDVAEWLGDSLHTAIMNLPAKKYDGTTTYDAYCRGHRDARHAAAQLAASIHAASPAATIAALNAEVERLRKDAERLRTGLADILERVNQPSFGMGRDIRATAEAALAGSGCGHSVAGG